MNDIDIRLLETLKDNDERALASAEKKLSHVPEGRIVLRTVRGRSRFYQRLPNTQPTSKVRYRDKYLGTNKKTLLSDLANKRYHSALCPCLTEEIAALNSFLDSYHPEKKYLAYECLPPDLRAQVSPLFLSSAEKCRHWQNQQFENNPFQIDPQYSHTTARGETVRSRAECILCDKVGRKQLAYHYEEKLVIGNVTVYPDITIMHPQTCELYYLEFFGMMDNPAYSKKAFDKIQLYLSAGLGPNLISIFDSKDAPFNFNKFDAILKSYFGV